MRIGGTEEQRLADLALAAIARLHRYGLAARRDVGVSLLVGGGMPLFGFLVLDWSEQSTAISLTLNLAISLAGDWLRVVLALGRFGAITREAIEDRYVFGVATALAHGRRTVNPKWTPSLAEVDQPRPATDALLLPPLGFGPGLFAAWMIGVDTTLHVETAVLSLGTLPLTVLVVGSLLVEVVRIRTRGVCSGGVAAQTSVLHATLVMLIGIGTLMQVGMALPDPSMNASTWLVLGCLSVLAAGLWYLRQIAQLRRVAQWLEVWTRRRSSL
jgi:hypothetical protein